MIFADKQGDDLLLVGWIEQPALRFDARGKKGDEEIAMLLGPGALCEKTGGLIWANELMHGAKAHKAFVLGDQRDWRPEHGAGKILVFTHGNEALWSGAEWFYFIVF